MTGGHGRGGPDCLGVWTNSGAPSSIASQSSSTRNAKVHEGSKLEELAEVLAYMTAEKAQIIEDINFSGLMKLPRIKHGRTCLLNREFSLWLMNRVDVKGRALDLGPRGRIPITPEDVQRVIGLPCQGVTIQPYNKEEINGVIESIKKNMLLQSYDTFDMDVVKEIVLRDYQMDIDPADRRCFMVAVVIYAINCLLAPRGQPQNMSCDILPYLTDPVAIFRMNWSEYVLRMIMESCEIVQKGKCFEDSLAYTSDGCILLLQIMYLDNMEFGKSNPRQFYRPRVTDFSYALLDKLIALDTDHSRDDHNKFGISEMRDPFKTIYTHGVYYRDLLGRIGMGAPISDDEHFKILEDYSKCFVAEQKKRIRNLSRQFANKLSKEVEDENECFMRTTKIWFHSRKRRREEDEIKQVHASSNRNRDGRRCRANRNFRTAKNVIDNGNNVAAGPITSLVLAQIRTRRNIPARGTTTEPNGNDEEMEAAEEIQSQDAEDEDNVTPIVRVLNRYEESICDVRNNRIPQNGSDDEMESADNDDNIM